MYIDSFIQQIAKRIPKTQKSSEAIRIPTMRYSIGIGGSGIRRGNISFEVPGEIEFDKVGLQ